MHLVKAEKKNEMPVLIEASNFIRLAGEDCISGKLAVEHSDDPKVVGRLLIDISKVVEIMARNVVVVGKLDRREISGFGEFEKHYEVLRYCNYEKLIKLCELLVCRKLSVEESINYLT